jgi:cupin superfamily acireductone dioxygenase involved in methionine salvage
MDASKQIDTSNLKFSILYSAYDYASAQREAAREMNYKAVASYVAKIIKNTSYKTSDGRVIWKKNIDVLSHKYEAIQFHTDGRVTYNPEVANVNKNVYRACRYIIAAMQSAVKEVKAS